MAPNSAENGASPPGSAGTFLITDPTGPGDFFRSGPISTWPTEPAAIASATGVVPLTYGALKAKIGTPRSIKIDAGVTAATGFLTGFQFTPFKIVLNSISFSLSSTPGAIQARFVGVLDYFTLFFPRRTDITGAVDLTLTPSGDATTPSALVSVRSSNWSLSSSFTTPLSTPLLALLAPAFSGTFSGPLTAMVNTAAAPLVAMGRAMVPTAPAGTPLFSAAATLSVRRIIAAPSGLILQVIMSELMAVPATPSPVPGPAPGGPPPEPRFVVSIDPAPELGVANTYVITVRQESDLAALEDATVRITTFAPVTGTASSITGQSDAQGIYALSTTLGARFRPSNDPTHTGGLQITLPGLTVTKAGFEPYSQDLGN